jgi:hypothetical protein
LNRAPRLSDALEAELDAIRSRPGDSVGLGEKGYAPYEPNIARFLISHDDPAVTQRLLAEMDGADRTLALALLHVLGRRSDPTVDAALRTLLDDPALRATSAYQLGRAGFKPYPKRPRDLDADRAALRRHLDDTATFEDPFQHQTFRVQDFVLAAFVRLTGPRRFTWADPEDADDVGYELPQFDDATRAYLLEQAQRIQ